jgi:hypothetical protein
MRKLGLIALYLSILALAGCAQGMIGNAPGRAGPTYDDKAGGHGGGDGGGGSM